MFAVSVCVCAHVCVCSRVCSIFFFKIHLRASWLLKEWANRFLALCHLWSLHSATCRTHQCYNEKQNTDTHAYTRTHMHTHTLTQAMLSQHPELVKKSIHTLSAHTHTHIHRPHKSKTSHKKLHYFKIHTLMHTPTDVPTHWGQQFGHRQHSNLLFRLQWKNLPFDPEYFQHWRRRQPRNAMLQRKQRERREWIDAHRLCTGCF